MKPCIGPLEQFGASIWVLDQGKDPTKLDIKSKQYNFMGYGKDSTAFMYWTGSAMGQNILLSRNL